MYAIIIVLALTAAGLIGWSILKERQRANRRRAIRQRHDDEAKRNWKATQERVSHDSLS